METPAVADAVARRVVSAVDVAWWESAVRAFTGPSRGAAKLTVRRYELSTESEVSMKVRVCPKCGKHNLENAWQCIDCGATLSMKTLMDTEIGELLSVTPIAGHATLSEISAYFEQDVIETLKTTARIDESIIWGCDFVKLSQAPPFIFGYLIITSRQLICVRFVNI